MMIARHGFELRFKTNGGESNDLGTVSTSLRGLRDVSTVPPAYGTRPPEKRNRLSLRRREVLIVAFLIGNLVLDIHLFPFNYLNLFEGMGYFA